MLFFLQTLLSNPLYEIILSVTYFYFKRGITPNLSSSFYPPLYYIHRCIKHSLAFSAGPGPKCPAAMQIEPRLQGPISIRDSPSFPIHQPPCKSCAWSDGFWVETLFQTRFRSLLVRTQNICNYNITRRVPICNRFWSAKYENSWHGWNFFWKRANHGFKSTLLPILSLCKQNKIKTVHPFSSYGATNRQTDVKNLHHRVVFASCFFL